MLSSDIDKFLSANDSILNFKNLECLAKDGNFVFFPEELETLNSENEKIKCIGSLPNSLISSTKERVKKDKPYVILSFGSVLDPMSYPTIVQEVIRLCEDKDFHLYISTANEMNQSNITAMPYLPLNTLLSEAKLYIHHGGANSFNEASRLGVPQILIPLTTDQPIQGDILKKIGHGFVLEKENISFNELKSIVTSFSDNESIVNCKRLE